MRPAQSCIRRKPTDTSTKLVIELFFPTETISVEYAQCCALQMLCQRIRPQQKVHGCLPRSLTREGQRILSRGCFSARKHMMLQRTCDLHECNKRETAGYHSYCFATSNSEMRTVESKTEYNYSPLWLKLHVRGRDVLWIERSANVPRWATVSN